MSWLRFPLGIMGQAQGRAPVFPILSDCIELARDSDVPAVTCLRGGSVELQRRLEAEKKAKAYHK